MSDSENIKVFDWFRIFFSENLPLTYFWEIAFRTFLMFLALIIGLKFLSKRGVKQMSVFELAILIALGSAVGDPMFYNHIPILHGITVLVIVILFYRVITGFTATSKPLEAFLEGEPVCLIEEGRIMYENYTKVGLPDDKFFAELRLKSIDHLGQVRKAYLETSGEISIYYYDDSDVRPGLPIYPELLEKPLLSVSSEKDHACISCGHIQKIREAATQCENCTKTEWILPKSAPRIK